jgi:hypothetical protein
VTFIETYDSETESSFRVAVEEFLSRDFRGEKWRPNWWHPFEIGPATRYVGRIFREFKCIAGSVHGLLLLRATEIGWARAILLVGERQQGALVMPPSRLTHLSARLLIEGRESWIEPFDLEDSVRNLNMDNQST